MMYNTSVLRGVYPGLFLDLVMSLGAVKLGAQLQTLIDFVH